MWDPFDPVFRAAQFEPTDDRSGIPVGALAMMGPIRFSCDDVLEPIAIDIGQFDRMEFGYMDSVGVFGGFAPHDQVAFELPLAFGSLLLLPPHEPVAMGIEAGDHIVEPVGIDIVSEHIGSAWAKRDRFKIP